ncbi:MAG: diguanylate cyclase [Chloroflexi bacterium]|nr:diguanylate cyclase [Chloroflexota bacterium]
MPIKELFEGKRLRKNKSRLVFVWSAIVVLSLLLSFWNEYNEIRNIAENTARASFYKDLAFRVWGASHGGVYVPVTERTQPNPHLSHIPKRDIQQPDGTLLTLMNPAYMLRQMMNEYPGLYGAQGRITSLQYLYDGNAPDDWEKEALLAFEIGVDEVFEYVDIEGEPYLRLMRPMITEEDCLKCHAFQGYEVGDVRGGIGVSVPLTPLYRMGVEHNYTAVFGYFFLWLLGFLGIKQAIKQEMLYLKKHRYLQEKLQDQAVRDPLTGIFNRRYMEATLQQELAKVARTRNPLSLVMIDLDGLKKINDLYGHFLGGDRAIKALASEIQSLCRESDVFCRYAGDEFIVILSGTSCQAAYKRALEWREAVEKVKIKSVDAEFSITISAGISAYPAHGETLTSLIQHADDALYQAKKQGRNRVVMCEKTEK